MTYEEIGRTLAETQTQSAEAVKKTYDTLTMVGFENTFAANLINSLQTDILINRVDPDKFIECFVDIGIEFADKQFKKYPEDNLVRAMKEKTAKKLTETLLLFSTFLYSSRIAGEMLDRQLQKEEG